MKTNYLITALLAMMCFACSEGKELAEEGPGEEPGDLKAYYLDATQGNDKNSGSSPQKAWRSLAQAGSIKYQPGDKLLLKRGDKFFGKLEFTGEGTATERIVIDAYGNESQPLPVVHGGGALYGVHIYNSSYVTIQNLEITNTGKEDRERSGLKVECDEYGESKGITVNRLYIHDVTGPLLKGSGRGCGILMDNRGTDLKSRFVDMVIENCHIKDCTRDAMIWQGGKYYKRGSQTSNWYPNLNTIIRNNLIEGIAGDAIVPVGCDNTLIEYNVVRSGTNALKNTASACIWPWSSDNTTIQFNDVSGFISDADGQAFDSDYNCQNTIIQYNYSHDNNGGMVLLCDDPSQKYSIGVLNTTVKYNISIDDGFRATSKADSPAINFIGPSRNAVIEHNIIHTNHKKTMDAHRMMVVMSDYRAYPENPTLRRNVFYASEESSFKLGDKPYTFDGNWYLGSSYTNQPTDANGRTTSDIYQEDILSVDAKGYGGLYKLMEKREVGGRDHYFVKKEAIEAFFTKMGGSEPEIPQEGVLNLSDNANATLTDEIIAANIINGKLTLTGTATTTQINTIAAYAKNVSSNPLITHLDMKQVTGISELSYAGTPTTNFKACTSLTEVNLPTAITNLNQAFSGCTNLVTVTGTENVKTALWGFNKCTNLTTINLPSLVEVQGTIAYTKIAEFINETVQRVNSDGFANCTFIKKIELPNCTSIKQGAFYNNSSSYALGEISLTATEFTVVESKMNQAGTTHLTPFYRIDANKVVLRLNASQETRITVNGSTCSWKPFDTYGSSNGLTQDVPLTQFKEVWCGDKKVWPVK